MRDKLKTLVTELVGKDEILWLKSSTLRELLLECQGMCNPGPQNFPNETPVICKPNPAGAGFRLSIPEGAAGDGTHVAPYTMLATPSVICVDTWDIDAPPPGTDGVIWGGPRHIYAIGATDTTTDDDLDDTEWTLRDESLLTRTLTYDSAGRLVAISAEYVSGAFSFR